MKRGLAAILSADVVGYSRLMERDEIGTLAEMQRHRDEFFDPKTAEHHGRIVKLMGDGTLMEFASVVDAVAFAVDVQVAMLERNAGVPQNRQIVFRIGINLGDIVHQDDDIHGDGVNVAARLESLAEPGGICISRSTHDQVRDKLDLKFDDQGEIKVKNIVRPIRVFQVIIDDKAASLATPVILVAKKSKSDRKSLIAAALAIFIVFAAGIGWWQPWQPEYEPADKMNLALKLPDKPSIAVLPFDNLSEDTAQAYFADGMTDDLITDLSKLSGIFVISRNSTFTYKGKPVKIRQVAEELGVRYVLEGSVRRVGDQVRINAQLIDAFSGYHLWAERYDGSVENVFKLQDRVIGQIVAALAVNLTPTEVAKKDNAETPIPAAYDYFLQGLDFYHRQTPQDYRKAIGFFKQAIKLDPVYNRAHAFLAKIYYFANDTKWDVHLGIEYEANNLAKHHLAKAMESPNADALQISAEVLYSAGQKKEALAQINRAIALEPNNPRSYLTKAWLLNLTGGADEAENNTRLAMRLNPDYGANYLRSLAQSLFFQHRHEEASKAFEDAVSRSPGYEFGYNWLAATYGHLGKFDQAKTAIAKYNELTKETIGDQLTIKRAELVWGEDWAGLNNIYLSHFLEGLRRAGVPEGGVTIEAKATQKKLVTFIDGGYEVEGVIKIDVARAKTLHDRGVVFIDARGAGPYNRRHIPGATHIYYSSLSREKLSRLVKPDEAVVFYCGGEDCPLAPKSCAKALNWGYTKVYYFAAGYPGWKLAGGYEVEK